jgi:Holliday junction resolvase RusA-like endonuclease
MSGIHVGFPWKKHAKQRPRSGRGHTYTPTVTKEAEKIIRDNFLACVGPDFKPLEGPLRVGVAMSKDRVHLTIHEIEPRNNNSLNGDIDNYLKTVLDALNGVAWVDDKQIDYLEGWKL